MSGSGKTTLAKAVYDRIVPDFDASCFVENISCYKHTGPNWKVHLQRDVISRFNGDDYRFRSVSASSTIKIFVRDRKVLLVLDDVDKYEQLQALGVQDPPSFGWGSRILVTTTNKQSLCGLRKYTSYDIELLNGWESSKLFTGLVYENGESADEEFVDEIVSLAGGVPLVLEVWARYFKSHERRQWPTLLEKLRRIPHEDIQGKLKVSYDSLSPRAKNLFLDIACFFNGRYKDEVIKVLEDKDNAFFPDIEIQNLMDRYLVKQDKNHRLTMHDVIRDMGREVVRQENEDDPRQRSRLEDSDAEYVLEDCSGTDSVISIRAHILKWDESVGQALAKMSNLRFICFYPHEGFHEITLNTNDEIMPPLRFKHLKYLKWVQYPFKCLDILDMRNVVVIELWDSKLEILWEGFKSMKKLRILRVESLELRRTGSFIGLENLELLDLEGCQNLEELDCSIGCLQKLVTLCLTGCHELKMVPWKMIHKLTSLEVHDLQVCPNILNIYHELWNLPNISSIKYKLENTGELWNPPNNFNIISHIYNYTTEVVPKEKLDSMDGTSKGQGEVPTFPKFKYIDVYLIKSHDQNFKWRVHHSM
uniref:disease resistance protein RPV1-like n=1 Tax=Erigeron canadensis TaxID=72917 RepID=UPI001CB90A2D|nr:disease resistance protein RPV1-like [Erigeron canadensis]